MAKGERGGIIFIRYLLAEKKEFHPEIGTCDHDILSRSDMCVDHRAQHINYHKNIDAKC